MSIRSCSNNNNDHNSKTLTLRQELFAQKTLEYAGNATKSYREIYGEKKNDNLTRKLCNQLMRNPNVKNRIAELERLRLAVSQITADYILRDILEIGDEARSEKRYSEALKSRELLGKNKRLFADVLENRINDAAITETDHTIAIELLREQTAEK